MTPQKYALIKAIAEDERGDPQIRQIAQRCVDRWKSKMEEPKSPLHPGMRRSSEYQAWVKGLNIGSKREPRT